MTKISQPSDPYAQAIAELKGLSNQIANKPVDKMLLRCDKHGHFSFEEKSFFGTIKRFFTVTLFGSTEYNFDSNIKKIGKLFLIAHPELGVDPSLKTLETKINLLIDHVVDKRGGVTTRAVTRSSTSETSQKINALKLQHIAHTAPPSSVSLDQLASIETLRNTYETLSFATKRASVLKLADEMQGFVCDSPDLKKDYSEHISWLAQQCASFCELESSFALYGKVLDETGELGQENAFLEQFAEVGLLLKRFTAIEHTLKKLTATKRPQTAVAAIKTIEKRIERIQTFADGDVNADGFTDNEITMLRRFAEAYKTPSKGQPGGFQRLKTQAVQIRDFLIYSSGNTEFNRRLKVQLEDATCTIKDENVLSAIDFFATFSFKSDPAKWQNNQVHCEHMSLVQQLYDARENLNHKQRLSKLDTTNSDAAPKFITNDRGLSATADQVIVEVENIPGKTTKHGHRKPKQIVTKWVAKGAKATTAPVWIKERKEEFTNAQSLAKKNLDNETIPGLEETIKRLENELKELSAHFPKIVGKNPQKLQMVELPVIDSIYRFNDSLTNDMRESLSLDKNPQFKAEALSLETLTEAYEWIQERCLAESFYNTGDISFVNELKKEQVTGKAGTDFTDKAALALFPYGHMAFIDNDHGPISFSHQRLAFDHGPVSLAEFLYYDTYRLDLKKLATPKAYAAINLDLVKNGKDPEVESQARNMTKEEFLLNELEDRFQQMVVEELEEQRQSDPVTNEKKWEGVERPDFTKIRTLNELKEWQAKANSGRTDEMKLELYELFEIPDDCEPDIQARIQGLRIECLRDVYKGLTNDENTQKTAFLNSWLFAGLLSPISGITDKKIDPRKVQMMGEMCCSQFTQLITLRALKRLNNTLNAVKSDAPGTSIKVPTLTQKRYNAATTEFVLKEFRDILRPIRVPSVMQDLVELPKKDFLEPIPIDSTVSYMAKRLIGAY